MSEVLEIKLPAQVAEVSVAGAAGDAESPSGPDEQQIAQLREQMEQAVQRDRAALSSAREALQKAAAELGEVRRQVVADAEQQLVELAVDIAGKILVQEIKSQGYEIDPIVKEALSQAPTRKGVVVRLNPDDLSRCQAAGEQTETDGDIRFVADVSVPPAGCVVETEEGVVESDPRQRLEDVGEALKEPE